MAALLCALGLVVMGCPAAADESEPTELVYKTTDGDGQALVLTITRAAKSIRAADYQPVIGDSYTLTRNGVIVSQGTITAVSGGSVTLQSSTSGLAPVTLSVSGDGASASGGAINIPTGGVKIPQEDGTEITILPPSTPSPPPAAPWYAPPTPAEQATAVASALNGVGGVVATATGTTITITTGGSASSPLSLPAGVTLNIAGGQTLSLTAGGTINESATVEGGGTLTVTTGPLEINGTLNLEDGTLDGAGDIIGTGTIAVGPTGVYSSTASPAFQWRQGATVAVAPGGQIPGWTDTVVVLGTYGTYKSVGGSNGNGRGDHMTIGGTGVQINGDYSVGQSNNGGSLTIESGASVTVSNTQLSIDGNATMTIEPSATVIIDGGSAKIWTAGNIDIEGAVQIANGGTLEVSTDGTYDPVISLVGTGNIAITGGSVILAPIASGHHTELVINQSGSTVAVTNNWTTFTASPTPDWSTGTTGVTGLTNVVQPIKSIQAGATGTATLSGAGTISSASKFKDGDA
jgi:hypothetical protein